MTEQSALAEWRVQDKSKKNMEQDKAAHRRKAYMLLITEHQAGLLRTARRLCGGAEDQAQDLTQETLVRGYEAFLAGRFQPDTNARAWLLRILMNLYITQYNRRVRWDAGIDVDTLTADGATGPESLRAAPADQPESALLASTLDEPVERALAKLSEPLRACVILVDLEGAEYTEAAALLDIPVGTIRSRLARARLQLHALLYGYAQERRRV